LRILITRGSGFIGSHLSQKLLSEGHEVLVVDNFYTSSRENISHLLGNPKFEIIRHDVIPPMIAKTKSKSKMINHDLPQYDPKQWKSEISKARGLLNWRHKSDNKQGSENTKEYFKTKV